MLLAQHVQHCFHSNVVLDLDQCEVSSASAGLHTRFSERLHELISCLAHFFRVSLVELLVVKCRDGGYLSQLIHAMEIIQLFELANHLRMSQQVSATQRGQSP